MARIPHADRHGLLWLDRGNLTVESGCLRFVTAGGSFDPGDYQIPHQTISIISWGRGPPSATMYYGFSHGTVLQWRRLAMAAFDSILRRRLALIART